MDFNKMRWSELAFVTMITSIFMAMPLLIFHAHDKAVPAPYMAFMGITAAFLLIYLKITGKRKL